jgi:hypothetical protein
MKEAVVLWTGLALVLGGLSGCCDAEKAGEKVGATASRFARGAAKALAKEGEKTGEALGEGAAKLTTGAAKGIGKHGDKVGEAVGAAGGKVIEGTATGLQKSLGYRDLKVQVAADLGQVGVSVEQSRVSLDDKQILLDLRLSRAFSGNLQLTATDKSGKRLFSVTSTLKFQKESQPQRVAFSAPPGFAAFEAATYQLARGK